MILPIPKENPDALNAKHQSVVAYRMRRLHAYSTMRFRLVKAFIEMTLRPETQTDAKRKVVTPPRTLAGIARKTPEILARTPYMTTAGNHVNRSKATAESGPLTQSRTVVACGSVCTSCDAVRHIGKSQLLFSGQRRLT